MKLSLLSIVFVSSSFDSVMAQPYLPRADCVKLCYDYRKSQLSKQICNPTLAMTPKPTMYKSCTHGLFMGFEHACTITCSGENYREETGVLPGNSFEACKSETRNSNAMDWCRHAYDVTFRTTPPLIQSHLELLHNQTNTDQRVMMEQDNNYAPTFPNENWMQTDDLSPLVNDESDIKPTADIAMDEMNVMDPQIEASSHASVVVMNEESHLESEDVAPYQQGLVSSSVTNMDDLEGDEIDYYEMTEEPDNDDDTYDYHGATFDPDIADEAIADGYESTSLEVLSA